MKYDILEPLGTLESNDLSFGSNSVSTYKMKLLLLLTLTGILPIQLCESALSNKYPPTGSTTTVTLPETVDLTDALVTTVAAQTDNGAGLSMTLSNPTTATFEISIQNPAGATPGSVVTTNDQSQSDASAGLKTGKLTLKSWGDSLKYDTNPSTSTLTVEIALNDGTQETSTVAVTILNVNDEVVTTPRTYDVTVSPAVETSTVSITEQTVSGNTNLFKVTIEDEDFSDDKSPITLELKPAFSSVFGVEACVVTATYPVYECFIYVKDTVVLDYEDVPVYEMKLVFTDGISSETSSVTVSVTNEVDENPSFETTNLPNEITLAENPYPSAPATPEEVYKVVGVNNDGSKNPNDLQYSLTNENSIQNSAGENLFQIDSTTGVISRTINTMSYEDFPVPAPNTAQFNLEIEVFLTDDPTKTASSTLEVFIENVCEPPYFLVTDQSFRFDENEPIAGDFYANGGVDKVVVRGPTSPPGYSLEVQDPDVPTDGSTTGAGHTQVITYSIGDFPNKGLFSLDCNGGTTFTLSSSAGDFTANCNLNWVPPVDYETLEQRPVFLLPIIATDSCNSDRQAELLIEVAIRNTNDNRPIFIDTGTYDATISELSKRGTYITTVTAYDPDADPDTTISYSLLTKNSPDTTEPGSYWFYIETVAQDAEYSTQNVGKVYLKYPWDRDTLGNTATLEVRATDNQPTTSGYATGGNSVTTYDVVITFTDMNDNRPYFHTFWNRELPYNEINDYYIGLNFTNNVTSVNQAFKDQDRGVTNDLGVNNDFEFRFMAPSLYFDIDRVSGEITKTDETLVPDKRYDVFVVSYDLGSNPEVKYSPMGIVRIDAYERKDIHVIFHMGGITTTYFNTHKKRFINIMDDLFSNSSWAFRVYDYKIGNTGNLEVTLYALTSDITDQVRFMNITKTYVQKGELLSVTRINSDGTPADNIRQSTDGSGVLDDFNIVLVEPEFTDSISKRNWWTGTEIGLFVIILIIVLGIVLLVALGVLIYWFLTREKLPEPPKLPKVVPKEEKVRTGPGPQILSSDDDEFVARPKNDAEMRGYDAVTGREYIANPITGERTWVHNEGDIY